MAWLWAVSSLRANVELVSWNSSWSRSEASSTPSALNPDQVSALRALRVRLLLDPFASSVMISGNCSISRLRFCPASVLFSFRSESRRVESDVRKTFPGDTLEMESFSLSFFPSSWGDLGPSAPNSGCTVDELFTARCFWSTRGFSRCETSTNPSASSNAASPESVKSSSETSQGYAVMRVSWHEGLHLTSAFVPARMEVALKSQIHSKKIAKSQRPGRVSILGDFSHFGCVKNVPSSLLSLSLSLSSPGKVEFANVLRGGAAARAQVFQVLMQTMHQRRSWRLIPGRQERGAPRTHPRLNLTGERDRRKAALLIKFSRRIILWYIRLTDLRSREH